MSVAPIAGSPPRSKMLDCVLIMDGQDLQSRGFVCHSFNNSIFYEALSGFFRVMDQIILLTCLKHSGVS